MVDWVVNTALRPQKPDGLLGTERAPLTSSDTQSRELSGGLGRVNSVFLVPRMRPENECPLVYRLAYIKDPTTSGKKVVLVKVSKF